MPRNTNPEAGQLIFHPNSIGEYECPEYVVALLEAICDEIDIVFWNLNQKQWGEYEDLVDWPIEYRSFCWDEESENRLRPNFKFEDIEIRWYKHRGRSVSVNKEMSAVEWVGWFDRCLAAIKKKNPERLRR